MYCTCFEPGQQAAMVVEILEYRAPFPQTSKLPFSKPWRAIGLSHTTFLYPLQLVCHLSSYRQTTLRASMKSYP